MSYVSLTEPSPTTALRLRTLGGITEAGEGVVVGATVVVRGGGGGTGSGDGTVVDVLEELDVLDVVVDVVVDVVLLVVEVESVDEVVLVVSVEVVSVDVESVVVVVVSVDVVSVDVVSVVVVSVEVVSVEVVSVVFGSVGGSADGLLSNEKGAVNAGALEA
jgi:hypothetical protein